MYNIIYLQICEGFGIEYICMRVWVGFWVTIFAVIIVMFDGSMLVKFFTRFVEEIFATLISVLFIYEAFVRMKKVRITSNYKGEIAKTKHLIGKTQ